ncbi:MAG: Rrf2 family transcriptional regulator [Ideonella sp.]|nr:Rrf2 family transcriptional regulator [Ideonella sp.]MCC7455955.1 Rrf2 family transcriptional regulator [Nitrospira sp.]
MDSAAVGSLTGSWAVRAMILIALDHHMHHWCALDWLARRLELPPPRVREVAEALACEGLIDRSDDGPAGHMLYGVLVQPGREIVQ